jgi:methionyl aminopeptidase
MTKLKSEQDIKFLREGGRHLSVIMHELKKHVRAGNTTLQINELATKLILEMGDEPSLLNYKPYGANRPYPATICISINDEIVHGIPNETVKTFKEGDIVGLDLVLTHQGVFVDMAETVAVGEVSREAHELMDVTREALEVGISVCKPGNKVGDIGCAIEAFVKPMKKFSIVEELGGHGVGHKVHEEPYVANFCMKEKGPTMVPGMVLALEPIINLGTKHVVLEDDGYTFKTADGKLSAHFEHTVLITEEGCEVMTRYHGK